MTYKIDKVYSSEYEKLKARVEALEKENERLTNQLLTVQTKLTITSKNYNNVIETAFNLITKQFSYLEDVTKKRIQQLINDAEARKCLEQKIRQGFYNFEYSNEEEEKVSPYDFTEPENGESNDDMYF